jgi:TetR/AcrR family transcriptional regulator, transcriptional repressor for nem operon
MGTLQNRPDLLLCAIASTARSRRFSHRNRRKILHTAAVAICKRLFRYSPQVGRPKQFDRDEVLTRALDLFWQRGYRGVSVRELAKAMGVNVATLYTEFVDKESLYAEALAKYESENVSGYIGSLERPDANFDACAKVLSAFADFASSGTAPGCLITNSAIEQVPDPARSQATLLRYAERLQSAYSNALKDPSDRLDPQHRDGLAQVLTATTLGLFVLIRAQAPAEIIRCVVDTTLVSLSQERPPSIERPIEPQSRSRTTTSGSASAHPSTKEKQA